MELRDLLNENEDRLNKTVMKKQSGIIYLSALIAFCACKHDNSSYQLEKYVYEDDINVLHVDEECSMLKSGKNRKGHSIYAKLPIDTTQILEVGRVCSKCVNSVAFDHLRNICLRNKEIDSDRRWLYDKLDKSGYNLEEYDLFVYHLSDARNRQYFFDIAQSEGWNIGTYDEFSKLLGFEATQETK